MLYLHVGFHKTGTSSIQETCFASRQYLRERGVAYFEHSANHSAPLMWAFRTSRRMTHPITVNAKLSESGVLQKARDVENRLTTFLEDRTCPLKLISGEGISYFNIAEIGAMKAFLDQFGVPIKVIIYIRNFYDYMNSEIQELVKWGWTLPILADAVKQGKTVKPNYKRKIGKFINAFGRPAVEVRLFHPKRLLGGDLLIDFCDAIGRGDVYDGLTHMRANESLTSLSTHVLSDYNEIYPVNRESPIPNPARSERIKLYLREDHGSKFKMSDRSTLSAYEGSLEEDVEYLGRILGKETLELLTARPALSEHSNKKGSSDNLTRSCYQLSLRMLGSALVDLEDSELTNEILLGLLKSNDIPNLGSVLKQIRTAASCRRLASALQHAARPDLAQRASTRADELEGVCKEDRDPLESHAGAEAERISA